MRWATIQSDAPSDARNTSEDRKAHWTSYIAPLCNAHNDIIKSSTGFSPYYIMFDRQPKLAIHSSQRWLSPCEDTARVHEEAAWPPSSRLQESAEKRQLERLSSRMHTMTSRRMPVNSIQVTLFLSETLRNEGNRRSKTGGRRIIMYQPNRDIPYTTLKWIHQQQGRWDETCYSRYDSSGTMHQSTLYHNVVVASTLITINLIWDLRGYTTRRHDPLILNSHLLLRLLFIIFGLCCQSYWSND